MFGIMFWQSNHSRLFNLSLLGLLIWLPLANAHTSTNCNDGSGESLSTESVVQLSDMVMGYGGLSSPLKGSLCGVITYTTHQLNWYNHFCSICFNNAKTIFLSNKEQLIKKSFCLTASLTREAFIIHSLAFVSFLFASAMILVMHANNFKKIE